ncbi:MAG TPA: hypothetical protein VF030_07740 [Solirubrobacterales bacterium]
MRKMLLAAAAFAAATPALAQTQQGLVNVNLSDIQVQLQDILSHNNVSVQVPANVQLPIGIAAKVCNVNVAALAQQKGTQSCDGSVANESTARAIAQALQRGQNQ